MTNQLAIETFIWKILDGSSLKTAITGKIRKGERPAASTKEDISVNSLAVPNTDLQLSVANVNIFVPDIVVNENGVQEQVINHARLETLTVSALAILNDVVVDGDHFFDVQQVITIADPESKSHFSNIRINFRSINLN